MRRVVAWLAVAGVVGCGESVPQDPPVDERDPLALEPVDLTTAVDPFVGTGGVGFATGSTYPGPALPFGMIHLGPDTSTAGSALPAYHCSGYRYEDSHIDGFSLLRMNGTGVPDYGTIAIMPTDGMSDQKRQGDGYRAAFDHATETAEPGYYRVELDGGIVVEITTATRAGMFRFTFPNGVDPTVLLDLEHTIGEGTSTGGGVTLDRATGRVSGWMHNDGQFSGRFGGFPVFVALSFEQAPEELGLWDEAGLSTTATTAEGIDLGAWARFPAGTTQVLAKVGVSFVDEAGAAQNLQSELGDDGFDTVAERARARWNEVLSSFEIYNASDVQRIAVASAIYHAHLMPTLISDVDHRVRDTDGAITTGSGPRYSDFSLWDTYRTLHPWLMLADDPINADFVASLVAFGQEGGAIPRWSLAHGDVRSMIGSPGEIVLAESAQKGIAFADEEAAYDIARVAAFGPPPGAIGGRGAIEDYLALGYVPADRHGGSVSRTQEYAIADDALARWATRLGRDDDAAVLAEHGRSYERHYDAEIGFFRGIDSDGAPAEWSGPVAEGSEYTEGSAWQYLWLVPQHPDRLAEILGGRDAALDRLRFFFDESEVEAPVLGHRSYYWHGNEPGLHVPFLFAMWGERAEGARWVRWVADSFYGTGPEGLAGNDDSGTLSAWLLFASAGIYPLAGSDRYVVTVPLFPKVVLHRPEGDLTVEADADPATHPRLVSIALDGEPLDGPHVSHEALRGEHVISVSIAK
ncbi:MAG: GH92 family glycosyl hydrolase [Polyangiaceae bacterium]